MQSKPVLRCVVCVGLMFMGLPSPAHAQLEKKTGPVDAPYSLTAADGTGLELVGLVGKSVIEGPLAFTELTMTFRNPQARQIEGHFKIAMPDGAAISRFAMKINDRWMEGEVVEKQAARRAYEDALHRRQDPALLEQDAGNLFRARVFPIPAHGDKSLIVSWSQELRGPKPAYHLPLRGLPKLGQLELSARVAEAVHVTAGTSLGGTQIHQRVTMVRKTDYTPEDDWIVPIAVPPVRGDGLRNGNLALARFPVPQSAASSASSSAVGEERVPTTAVLLFDTSASRAVDFEGRLQALAALVTKLPDAGIREIELWAFDQYTASIFTGSPAAFDASALDRLRARTPLGASDLSGALRVLADGDSSAQTSRRLIVMTDGVLTAGALAPGAIGQSVARLAERGFIRADAIVDSTARDERVLKAVVTAGLPQTGVVIEGRASPDAQIARLRQATLGEIRVSVPGAAWTWPDKLVGRQPGESVLVYADLPAGRPLTVRLTGGVTAEIEPESIETPRSLLHRSWVAARITRLLSMRAQADPDLGDAMRHQIIALSTRHRVLSPFTALVVLETENDYRRFGFERRARADILTIGATGIETVSREPPKPPSPSPAPRFPATSTLQKAGANATGQAMGRAGGRPGASLDRAPRTASKRKANKVSTRPQGRTAQPPADAAAAAFDAMAMSLESQRDRGLDRRSREHRNRPRNARPALSDPASAAMSDLFRGAARRARDQPAPPEPTPIAQPKPPATPNPFPGIAKPVPAPEPPPVIATNTESEGQRALREIEANGKPALTGRGAEIDRLLGAGEVARALILAQVWRASEPLDPLALIFLGRALQAMGQTESAARAFGSLLDLYPSRADMRRMAGNWLETLGAVGLELAADTYRVAAGQRPDHPSVYHLLAMALVRLGRFDEALTTLLDGVDAPRAHPRFKAVERILREDAELVAALWVAQSPGQRPTLEARLRPLGLRIASDPSLRFVLTWETDANDVDFHIFDRALSHAYFSSPGLASGGQLYADIRTGYGPECFTVVRPEAFPYRLMAHYFSRGPMGYGMGKLQVIGHDGRGTLTWDERPFVIMTDGAYVDLGDVTGSQPPPQSVH